MALKLLPFRQYDEQDVVNMFAFSPAVALASTTDDGQASQGSIVKIAGGNFNQDIITYGTDSYLGKTDYPHVGGDMYPTVSLTITGCGANETKGAVLGVTLNQTAKNDENGEKLLYNATKKEELQAVLPGQAVPVATKGIFTFSSLALANGSFANIAINGGIATAADGKISGVALGLTGQDNTDKVIGTVIGTGTRTSQGNTDIFAGNFVVVKLG
mgnify:FL=1|tara:strand:- start:101 stop:745 length:645 start_codon:yes stop_codon:yes gene_type:complete